VQILIISIVTALISAGVTLVVCLINNYWINKRHAEDAKETSRKQVDELKDGFAKSLGEVVRGQMELGHSVDLVKCRIDELAKDVDKHNKVIERTYKLEDRANLHDEQIRVANHRIEDLERAQSKK
jgi:hypothetical protein